MIHTYQDALTALYAGDCAEVLRGLPAESVHMVVTSPPYWGGIRSYRGLGDGQLGHEATPGEYVANLVRIFREVRRVLRDDGLCFVNLGDVYSGAQSRGTKRRAQLDSWDCGCSCHRLGDGRARTFENRSVDKHGDIAQEQGQRLSETTHGCSDRLVADRQANLDSASQAVQPFSATSLALQKPGREALQPLASQASTTHVSSLLSQCGVTNHDAEDVNEQSQTFVHAARLSDDMDGVPSSTQLGVDDVLASKSSQENKPDSVLIGDSSVSRTEDTACGSCSYRHYSTVSNHSGEGELAGIPFRVVLALQADGWRWGFDCGWRTPLALVCTTALVQTD